MATKQKKYIVGCRFSLWVEKPIVAVSLAHAVEQVDKMTAGDFLEIDEEVEVLEEARLDGTSAREDF